jgi:hypothetical protein
MTILLRLFAWGLAAAIAFATLGPAAQRPHSNLGQNGEHALAFVLLGIAFGLAYARSRLLTTIFVAGYTGLIEIMQLWAPRASRTRGGFCRRCAGCLHRYRAGRQPRLGDQARTSSDRRHALTAESPWARDP